MSVPVFDRDVLIAAIACNDIFSPCQVLWRNYVQPLHLMPLVTEALHLLLTVSLSICLLLAVLAVTRLSSISSWWLAVSSWLLSISCWRLTVSARLSSITYRLSTVPGLGLVARLHRGSITTVTTITILRSLHLHHFSMSFVVIISIFSHLCRIRLAAIIIDASTKANSHIAASYDHERHLSDLIFLRSDVLRVSLPF